MKFRPALRARRSHSQKKKETERVWGKLIGVEKRDRGGEGCKNRSELLQLHEHQRVFVNLHSLAVPSRLLCGSTDMAFVPVAHSAYCLHVHNFDVLPRKHTATHRATGRTSKHGWLCVVGIGLGPAKESDLRSLGPVEMSRVKVYSDSIIVVAGTRSVGSAGCTVQFVQSTSSTV